MGHLFVRIVITVFLLISVVFLVKLSSQEVFASYAVECGTGSFLSGTCSGSFGGTADCSKFTTGEECCAELARLQDPPGLTATCSDYCQKSTPGQYCPANPVSGCTSPSCVGLPVFCCNYSTPTTTPTPICTSGVVCSGSCTSSQYNTCSNNGTWSGGCVYTKDSSGNTGCPHSPAPNPPGICSADNCSAGYSCDGITCNQVPCSNFSGGTSGNPSSSCSSCLYNSAGATCGWNASSGSCASGSASCPGGSSSWYWYSCGINQCSGSPTTTPTTTPTATPTTTPGGCTPICVPGSYQTVCTSSSCSGDYCAQEVYQCSSPDGCSWVPQAPECSNSYATCGSCAGGPTLTPTTTPPPGGGSGTPTPAPRPCDWCTNADYCSGKGTYYDDVWGYCAGSDGLCCTPNPPGGGGGGGGQACWSCSVGREYGYPEGCGGSDKCPSCDGIWHGCNSWYMWASSGVSDPCLGDPMGSSCKADAEWQGCRYDNGPAPAIVAGCLCAAPCDKGQTTLYIPTSPNVGDPFYIAAESGIGYINVDLSVSNPAVVFTWVGVFQQGVNPPSPIGQSNTYQWLWKVNSAIGGTYTFTFKVNQGVDAGYCSGGDNGSCATKTLTINIPAWMKVNNGDVHANQ